MTQVCTRCVMDTSDPDITFDADGLCNHCHKCDLAAERTDEQPAVKARLLEVMTARVREAGIGREHDCVIGLSGGVDSSYLAYVVKHQLGLRPLAVHLDNGWNSKAAVRNIQKIVSKLDIDLITHVIDWEEFRDLQRAYLKASVIDVEALSDHAIRAVIYQIANHRGIKHILFGDNNATERILPIRWGFNFNDLINLRDIHDRFGAVPLRTFPQLGAARLRRYTWRDGHVASSPLNWIEYVRDDAKALLIRELGWTDYGAKHTESLFTKFFQGYLLPEKFGVDKRRAHLSTLINSGQITREQAVEELARPIYPPDELEPDLDYVAKKLGFSRNELAAIVATPPRSHFDFATDVESKLHFLVYPRIKPVYRELRRRVERVLPAWVGRIQLPDLPVRGLLRARRRGDQS